jgi:hypothetical protein
MELTGEPSGWGDQLVQAALELGFETLLVGVPAEGSVDFVRRVGEDVAPQVRERTASQ